MATLALTAIGTLAGGPLGGALGALAGRALDGALLRPQAGTGAKLPELALTTASYGTPMPRRFGRMRLPGTILWAATPVEHRQTTGGGKGRPGQTASGYTLSFAVALSSRRQLRVERIWADGDLLRGSDGALRTGGTMRFHAGAGDQLPDPLMAAAIGPACPAFRGIAYVVFEDLDLADYGNRVPALTFETLADKAADADDARPAIGIDALLEGAGISPVAPAPFAGLLGLADEGGPVGALVGAVGGLYPLHCDASGGDLVFSGERQGPPVALAAGALAHDDPGGAAAGGAAGEPAILHERAGDGVRPPAALRYIDVDRDFQPGVQTAPPRARGTPGGSARLIELPAVLSADTARARIATAAERAMAQGDRITVRLVELDPALRPGTQVLVPQEDGRWTIAEWEWRDDGITLALLREPALPTADLPGAATAAALADARPIPPTRLIAFGLPWDGEGADDLRIFAAPDAATGAWGGAALYAVAGAGLVAAGTTGRTRAVTGHLAAALPPSRALLFEAAAWLDVTLASPDHGLASADLAALAMGANRALVGAEILQFAHARPTGPARWRLEGLLRGRAGTEAAALSGTPAGAPFVLIDDRLTALDPAIAGRSDVSAIAAIGRADPDAVVAPIIDRAAAIRPLAPVHASVREIEGALDCRWTRRARGAWLWRDGTDVPLAEEREAYAVSLGDPDAPLASWETGAPHFTLDAAARADLATRAPDAPLWVRQIGSRALSPPLRLLATLLPPASEDRS